MMLLLITYAIEFVAALTSITPEVSRLALHPNDGGLHLPPGFRAVVVADNLGRLRFMAVGPTGDVYVKTRNEGIIALRDTNGDGRADVQKSFGAGGGTGVALRDGWLYHSTNSAVLRYRLAPGELVPGGEPEPVVADLPDKRQHSSKSFAFDDEGRLFVEVGSPSNAYGDPDRALGAKGKDPTEFLKTHGGFWRFDPDRLNQRQADGVHYSTGHRHVLAIAWNQTSRSFFFVMHGRDQLNTVAPEHYTIDDNAELPAEEMHVLREGANYGWPFTYYDPLKKARMLAPEYGGDNRKRAKPGKYPNPLVAFPAHWAPMQMAFYNAEQFPAKYRGGAFVAFHGSWNRAPKPQKGYNVTFVPFNEKSMPRGEHEVFAGGFAGRDEIRSPGDARFRPCGLAVGSDGSLYVADSAKGRVWRIVFVGKDYAEEPATSKAGAIHESHLLYGRFCATCHMADGSGVSGLQPAIKGSSVVTGDPATLIRLLLQGPDKALPADRESYANPMPVFSGLLDGEIAAILSYVRRAFGDDSATSVTPEQVASMRRGRR
jgi:glucose/arabinose dehydrogenase